VELRGTWFVVKGTHHVVTCRIWYMTIWYMVYENHKKYFTIILYVCCFFVFYVFLLNLCFLCIGHFVTVPLNFAFLHCLQHSFFEHIFNLYLYLYMVTVGIMISINSLLVIQRQFVK